MEKEAKRHEWYFVCKADNTCSGDRYPDLRTAEDTARGTRDTTKEVLQVDVGTDEKTWTNRTVQWEQRTRDRAVQWGQRALEVMSRGILPYVAKRNIITERSPTAVRMYGCIMCGTTRPEQSGPESAAVEALTRKGGNDKRKGNCKGKDTEMEKEVRLEVHCGHGEEREHRHEYGWLRHQCNDSTDTNLNSELARCTVETRVKLTTLSSNPSPPPMQWQRNERSWTRWFQMNPQVPCGSIIINQCTFQRTSV